MKLSREDIRMIALNDDVLANCLNFYDIGELTYEEALHFAIKSYIDRDNAFTIHINCGKICDMATRSPLLLADAMLGRLCKWLRIWGYDTVYASSWSDHKIAARARAENRIVLTRDRELVRRKGIPKVALTVKIVAACATLLQPRIARIQQHALTWIMGALCLDSCHSFYSW